MSKNKAILSKIKNVKRTQVTAENLVLNDVLDKKFVDALKRNFVKYGSPIAINLQLVIVPKKDTDDNKVVGTIILQQPSPSHFKKKTVLVSASNNKILETFLK